MLSRETKFIPRKVQDYNGKIETFEEMNSNPFIVFDQWFRESEKLEDFYEPNAMVLSTVENNKPKSRVVLLKQYDAEKFTFATQNISDKGQQIKQNPNVALNFYWRSMMKQVRIEGICKEGNDKESQEYYNSRNDKSKLASLFSDQSSKLNPKQFDEYKKKIEEHTGEVPLNKHFKLYHIYPNLIEFWIGQKSRAHIRYLYELKDGKWVKNMLYPQIIFLYLINFLNYK